MTLRQENRSKVKNIPKCVFKNKQKNTPLHLQVIILSKNIEYTFNFFYNI